MKARRAVCAGSFDPVTRGHLDLFRRAAGLFDELTVCVFHNVRKEGLFSAAERKTLIEDAVQAMGDIPNLRVDTFSGLLADYLRAHEMRYIVRGMRSADDLAYEQTQAELNRHLYAEAETVFLLTNPRYACVSSSAVREIASFHGALSDFVPPNVEQALREKFRGQPVDL